MKHENSQELAENVGIKLIGNKQMLALAESCTGGSLGQAVTAVPGCSTWFERGFVTYSNLSKTQMLGVDADLIHREGAVSATVVEQMAVGALRHSTAQWAIAVSGVAGPDGGSEARPVGTVWIAWVGPSGEAQAQRFNFPGSREAVRSASVAAGLRGLLDRLV